MPPPQPQLRCLLAHGLGLGLLAGGVVLGTQGAAQAIQYVFVDGNGNAANGLQLSFRSPGCTGPGACYQGSASITGSFDFDANTGTISNVDVQFDPDDTSQAVFFDFGLAPNDIGAYDFDVFVFFIPLFVTENRLVFGTTGGCDNGPSPCLDLQLAEVFSNEITGTPNQVITFAEGTGALGDFFVDANPGGPGDGGNTNNRRDLTFVSGFLRAVPSPFSALALLPLAGLKRYLRRIQRLSQAREAATSAAELG